MNIALLTAGGVGSRMNMSIPKQFVHVNDKPLIIYTLEKFERHPDIDAIVVTCLKGWENILRAYVKQFQIKKLITIVESGDTGQDSIRNGLLEIEKRFSDDDNVIIHDGNRAMVSSEIISDCIVKTELRGCGIASIPTVEVVLYTENETSSKKVIRVNI
ncbi:2-C-methyl-D-erythritol 4-phosphate cytidylyltransferase [Lactococcus piscium]|uniref:2-C-methyl-D-erythritol 4-phosphate cytidylyltransferase n=1 Tax=Pseudolactococcus piscium TaxID=1364 RepID=A0A2A5S240_9LACT|nr:2-C-methyl-D-erythritol 4-phosphate cytidylyltransferase [Lactococcus piscium]PCS07535.1 2-C-methyl-D-erythritol 4-phosphate cytidylyltransferase [Lactococcus piscium]